MRKLLALLIFLCVYLYAQTQQQKSEAKWETAELRSELKEKFGWETKYQLKIETKTGADYYSVHVGKTEKQGRKISTTRGACTVIEHDGMQESSCQDCKLFTELRVEAISRDGLPSEIKNWINKLSCKKTRRGLGTPNLDGIPLQ